jgi:hypothetical protein
MMTTNMRKNQEKTSKIVRDFFYLTRVVHAGEYTFFERGETKFTKQEIDEGILVRIES